jgi:hypothetical protein
VAFASEPLKVTIAPISIGFNKVMMELVLVVTTDSANEMPRKRNSREVKCIFAIV